MACEIAKLFPGRRLWALLLIAGYAAGAKADYYAAQNGQTPSYPYTTWASAASHIQDAVNAATNGATVWVGAGRYTLPPNFTNYMGSNVVYVNRLLNIRSSNGVPETTVIDGQGKNRGIAVDYPTASSVYQMVIDGLTITNCSSTNRGGGIIMESSDYVWTARVQNCVIANNIAQTANDGDYAYGGALFNYNTANQFGLIVSNCVIRANRVTNSVDYTDTQGGAFWIRNAGKKLFYGCLIEDNVGGNTAGAINSEHGTLEIENCILRRNRADKYLNAGSGGGAVRLNGLLIARNSLFYDNYSASASLGGAVACQRQYFTGALEFYNCTIVSNYGGGIFVRAWGAGQNYNPSLYIYNCVIQSNSAYNVLATPAPFNMNIIVNSCWYPTNGANPALLEINSINPPANFVNFAGEDFRLSPASPCLNAGTNQPWMTDYHDLDGHKRVRYGTVDAGAFEMIKDATIYLFR